MERHIDNCPIIQASITSKHVSCDSNCLLNHKYCIALTGEQENGLFPSYLLPLFQNKKSLCKAIHIKKCCADIKLKSKVLKQMHKVSGKWPVWMKKKNFVKTCLIKPH